MSAQHTPGPFAVENYHGDIYEVVDEETLAITVARLSGPRAKANAERIVLCLNCHDEMLALLQWIAPSDDGERRLTDKMHARIRAALAKALGQSGGTK